PAGEEALERRAATTVFAPPASSASSMPSMIGAPSGLAGGPREHDVHDAVGLFAAHDLLAVCQSWLHLTGPATRTSLVSRRPRTRCTWREASMSASESITVSTPGPTELRSQRRWELTGRPIRGGGG